MLTIILIITFLYIALIVAFIIGYSKVEAFESNIKLPKTAFSIIIPFRNEVKNLPALLQSISGLNYSENLFEIIFIDDNSEDESTSIIRKSLTKHNFKVINNERYSNSPKKDALTLAIKQAKHNWIITTDADCILPKGWLKNFDAFIQEQSPKMIVAPVNYSSNNSLLDAFQKLDFWSLQTTTVGGFGINKPFMNNGANLAYLKDIFNELHGFEGNNNIASGDDLFIMEKLLKVEPKAIKYLKNKNSVVLTKPQTSWKLLFNQRLRWAAKSSAYTNSFAKIVGLLVLLMNASLIIMFTLFIINEFNGIYLLVFFILKTTVDYFAIKKSALFFNEKTKHFLTSSIIYPFFSVGIVIYSLLFKYKWKGRTFKK